MKSAERRRQENQNQKKVSREEVAQRAYQLWQAAGQPFGRDLEYSAEAEAELLAARHYRPMEVGAAKTGPGGPNRRACMNWTGTRGAETGEAQGRLDALWNFW